MSIHRQATTKAFGVEPGWPTYRLRQARYCELGLGIAHWSRETFRTEKRLTRLLDVGANDGALRRYTELHSAETGIEYSGVDTYPFGTEFVYKHHDSTLHKMDLESGLPGLPSDFYDIVVCEQVLEHLKIRLWPCAKWDGSCAKAVGCA